MQDQDYILLISKQFSGEISPEEWSKLNEWCQESAENNQLLVELRQVWEQSATYGKTFSPDLDADFKRLQRQIQATEPSRRKMVGLNQYLLRAAALLIFLLGASWVYRQYFNAPAPQITAQASDVDKRLIELPDGSRVWLRRGAFLAYPAKFSGAERRVQLNGEAYFEVNHDASLPFRVDLPQGGLVEVLGTQFGVCSEAGADQISVLVRAGKVRFAPAASSEGTVLTAGKKAVFHSQTAKIYISEVKTFNDLAWQGGGLEFIKTPLAQVIADLEKYYHVKINLRNPALRSCPYTAPLTNQPIENVLESLALTYQMRVANTAPGQFELSGGSCH